MLCADRQIDRRILLQAESLEEAGWQVTIIAMPSDDPHTQDHARVVRLGQQSAIPVRQGGVLAVYRWVRQKLPMDSWLMRQLKAIAWRYVVDRETFFLKLYSPTVSNYAPTVFMAHDLPMLSVARQAAERCGAKLVYDSHELFSEQEFSDREKRGWSKIERKHIGACDAIITVNPSIARELEQRYGLSKVHVVYNAERAHQSFERQCYFHKLYGLPEIDKVLLLQGGISAGRNIEALVQAMALVKNKHVHLVVLGDGQLVERLVAMVRQASTERNVHFHAAVPQHQLLSLTASADAGVIPYQATCLNNYYCTPNKLFEFIAAGLPVLGSDLPEIRKIIEFHRIGQVADLSSKEKIASAIESFFSEEPHLISWRENARKASQVVAWEREGQKMVSIFEDLKK